jgi:hypothetical protein
MSLYAITYRSAYDNQRIKANLPTANQETLLCAPSAWTTQQVINAYLQHHPGQTVLACTPTHPLAA